MTQGFVPDTQPTTPGGYPPGFAPDTHPAGFKPDATPKPKATPGSAGMQWGRYTSDPIPNASPEGQKLFPTIDRIADKYGVPRSVLRAMVGIESLSSPDPRTAGSPKGAYGPAQMEPDSIAAAKRLNPRFDPTNPEDAISYMANRVATDHKKYGSWPVAGMAYNTGEGAIDSWLSQGGNLDDVNEITDSITHSSQDVRLYGTRIYHALNQEQAQLAHRQIQTRNANIAHTRTQQAAAIIAQKGKEDQSMQAQLSSLPMMVLFPQVGAAMEAIQSPVVQGPLQALGAYGELLTTASPLLGALGGRHPDVPHLPTPRGPMTMAQYEKHYGTQAKIDLERWERGEHHDPDIAGAYHDIIHAAFRGTQALATAEERYSVGSPGLMAALGHGKEDPRLDVGLRTTLDLFGVNPLKYLGFLTAAARTVPTVDRAMIASAAVGQRIALSKPLSKLTELYKPYAILRRAATLLGANADEAQSAGREMSTASHVAEANGTKIRDQVYGGLTPEQREEVGRRSQTLIRGQDVQPKNLNVPEPKKGPSLDDRAALDRYWRMMTDDKLLIQKLLVPSREFDPWTFLNMTGPNVWKDTKELTDGEKDFFAAQQRRGLGKGTLSEKGAHKVRDDEGDVKYQYYDQAKADNALSPKFDFADQLHDQLVSRGRLSILEDSLVNMRQKAGLATQLAYQTPTGELLGVGEYGYKKAAAVGRRVDRYIAVQKTLTQLGYSAEEARAVTRANPDAIKRILALHEQVGKLAQKGMAPAAKAAAGLESKLGSQAQAGAAGLEQAQTESEAARMTKPQAVPKGDEDAAAAARHFNESLGKAQQSTRDAANVASGVAAASSRAAGAAHDAKVAEHVANALYGPRSPFARKAARLQDRLFKAEIHAPEAKRFAEALKANMKAQEGTALKGMQESAAERARTARGGITGEKIQFPSGMPSLKPWFSYDPDAARFIESQGATSAEASNMSRFLTGFTNFYRMGVVYNVIRHPFVNLPIKFLAAGGTPGALLRAYRLGHDAEWSERLAAKSARHLVATQPLFGGSAATVFDTPLKNVYKEAVEKSDFPAGAKFLAGVGGTLNAGFSRAWRGQANAVFNWAEHNMQVSYFRELVEKGGLSEEEAANKTADVFWDSANVNKSGPEWWLNKALLFYPWLKSVIPVMMRAMVTHPQYVWLPYSRSQDWNRANGDPRWSQESEGTIYLGNFQGEDQYMSWPGPQKYLHDIGSVFMPGGEGTQGRMQALTNLATGELAPAISAPVKFLETMASKPTEPGPPNFDILWNKSAPEPVQHQQIAAAAIQQLPFGEAFGNVIAGTQQILKGNPATILSAMSFNPYGRPPPQVEKHQRLLFSEYNTHAGKINYQIWQVNHQPGSQAYKETKVWALRDHLMLRYLHYRLKAQLLTPGMSPNDKRTLTNKVNTQINALHTQANVLDKAASMLKRNEPPSSQQQLRPPTPTPSSTPSAAPSASPQATPSGFVPDPGYASPVP